MNVRTISSMPSPLVETDWLAENLESGDLHVIDCSVVMKLTDDGGYAFIGGRDEWIAGHIPGSTFIDVLADLADTESPLPMMMPSSDAFAAVMSAAGVSDGTRVVVYDRSNHAWAARVWWMLRANGFDTAAVLNGGWQKWVAEQRPVATRPTRRAPGRFSPAPRAELFASKTDVLEAIGDGSCAIVNSLSPDEHAGRTGRFPRKGRIAGSVNVYCQELIDPATHAYLPKEVLHRKFHAAGAIGPTRTITYCGAGIAASSDALALTLLGVDNVAVYDGSLAEWTADPALPMEADGD
jgi:thiosulfate/3-mercaptopyruvate sulfurtransferase